MSYINFFEESVVGGYAPTDTVITISDGSRLPAPPYRLVIFDLSYHTPAQAFKDGACEVVQVTGRTGNDITVTRGQGGTTAITIDAGKEYAIIMSILAEDMV